MAFFVHISDPEDLCITIRVPGGYNPDELEDAKRRAVDAYREVLQIRLDAGVSEVEQPETEADTETDEATLFDEGGETAK